MPIMHTFEYRDSNYSVIWQKNNQLYETKEEAHTAAQGKLIELSMGFTDRFNFEIKLTTVNTDPPPILPYIYTYSIGVNRNFPNGDLYHRLEIRKKRQMQTVQTKYYKLENIKNLIDEHNLTPDEIMINIQE